MVKWKKNSCKSQTYEKVRVLRVTIIKEKSMEPLSVVLVWNENDRTSVEKYIQYTTKMLSRDINKPFSRTINLPIFY